MKLILSIIIISLFYSPLLQASTGQNLIGKSYHHKLVGVQSLGGWMVGKKHVVSQYIINHKKYLSLEKITGHNAQGKASYTILDIMPLPLLSPGQEVSGGSCKYNGQFNTEIIAITAGGNSEWIAPAGKAWQAHQGTGKITEISTKGILCENMGWGI